MGAARRCPLPGGGRPRVAVAAPLLALTLALALMQGALDAAGAQSVAGLEIRPLPGLRAEAATFLVQGLEGGSLALALLPRTEAATRAAEDRWTLPIQVEIAGAPLLAPPAADGRETAVEPDPDDGADPARDGGRPESRGGAAPADLVLELYLYAVAEDGRTVAGHLAHGLRLDLAELGEALYENGLKIGAALDLPPGRHSLRLLLLDPRSARFSLRETAVELPEERLTLRFPARCGEWLEAALQPGAAAAGGLEAIPVVTGGGRLRALVGDLERQGAETAAASDGPEFSLARRGGAAGDAVTLPSTPAGGGAFELEVPELEAGIYELAVAGPDGTGAAASEAVWVIDPAAVDEPGCPPSWAEVLRRASGLEAPPPPDDLPPDTRHRQRIAYLEVLAGLGRSAEVGTAASRLAAFEIGEIAGATESIKGLGASQLAVARELAQRDPEVLLPILALHYRAYLEHYAARRFPLASHSREWVARMVDQVIKTTPSVERRPRFADLVAGFAAQAERRQMFSAAEELLERALALDPEHLEARLLLARDHEKLGRYEPARRELERLLASHAGHAEARLRLATLLVREGRAADAESELGRLLGGRPPAWIRSLAVQTLARLYLDAGRAGEAARLLARQPASLPDAARLELLAAYCLDRMGRGREAAGKLARLPAADEGPSPRLRYTEPDDDLLAGLESRVDRAVALRLPRLAKALEKVASISESGVDGESREARRRPGSGQGPSRLGDFRESSGDDRESPPRAAAR